MEDVSESYWTYDNGSDYLYNVTNTYELKTEYTVTYAYASATYVGDGSSGPYQASNSSAADQSNYDPMDPEGLAAVLAQHGAKAANQATPDPNSPRDHEPGSVQDCVEKVTEALGKLGAALQKILEYNPLANLQDYTLQASGLGVLVAVCAIFAGLALLVSALIGRDKDPDSNLARLLQTLHDALNALGGALGLGTSRRGGAGTDTRDTLPDNAQTTTNAGDVFEHLEDNCGIDPKLASERLHDIKAAAGKGPADNVLLDWSGGVWDPITRKWLGSLTAGGAKRIR